MPPPPPSFASPSATRRMSYFSATDSSGSSRGSPLAVAAPTTRNLSLLSKSYSPLSKRDKARLYIALYDDGKDRQEFHWAFALFTKKSTMFNGEYVVFDITDLPSLEPPYVEYGYRERKFVNPTQDKPLVALLMITKIPSHLVPLLLDTLRDQPPHPNIGLTSIYSTDDVDDASSPSSSKSPLSEEDELRALEEANWKSETWVKRALEHLRPLFPSIPEWNAMKTLADNFGARRHRRNFLTGKPFTFAHSSRDARKTF